MADTCKIRRIGVLTGGGDCPGLNAVIRAVTKTAMFQYGLEVWGIEDGYLGLIRNRMRLLARDDVSNILTAGGTILGTSNKANPSHFLTGTDEAGQPDLRGCFGPLPRAFRGARGSICSSVSVAMVR